MTAVQFQCPKCGATYDGSNKDISGQLRANGIRYWIEWDCMECECGEPSMLPVAEGFVLEDVGRKLASAVKAQKQATQLAINKPRVQDKFPWKPEVPQENVRDTYMNVELENGMRLEYWPATDKYRYKPIRKRGARGGAKVPKGGAEFIAKLAEELNGSGR